MSVERYHWFHKIVFTLFSIRISICIKIRRTPFTKQPVPIRFIGGKDIMPSYNSDSDITVKMIIDDSSIELFTTDGKQIMTDNYLTDSKFNRISLFTENGMIKVNELTVKSLECIWKKKD